jgi:hypothetical protein
MAEKLFVHARTERDFASQKRKRYVFRRNMKMDELLNVYFWKYRQRLSERLIRVIGGLARTCKASTGMIAQAIAVQGNTNFESACMFARRLSDR